MFTYVFAFASASASAIKYLCDPFELQRNRNTPLVIKLSLYGFVEDGEEDADLICVFVEDAKEDTKTNVFLWKTLEGIMNLKIIIFNSICQRLPQKYIQNCVFLSVFHKKTIRN